MLTWIKGLFVTPNNTSSTPRISFPDPPIATHEEQESQVISLRIKLPSRSPAAADALTNQLTETPSKPPAKRPTGSSKICRPATGLFHFNFASPRRLQQLSRIGIKTAADLRNVNIKQLVAEGRLPVSAAGWLRRRRSIVLLFLSIRSLRPIDATILHAIHRRRLSTVASEQPIRLLRDIERFLLTSAGQNLLGSKQPPTMPAIEKWVEQAKLHVSRKAQPDAQPDAKP